MTIPRARIPELEHDVGHTPTLAYEPAGRYGWLRCLAHGVPNPLVRWQYHDEYELHLIVATRGKVLARSGGFVALLQPRHRQQLHRLREPPAHQPCLPVADGSRPLHHQRLLRRGLNNVANFNRRFLQIKGSTPKEFRCQAEARFGAIA